MSMSESYSTCDGSQNTRAVVDDPLGEIPFKGHCPVCKTSYWDPVEMANHQYAKGHYKCDACDMQVRDFASLQDHNQKVHSDQQNLDCPGCGEHFFRAGALMQHVDNRTCPVIKPELIHLRRDKTLAFEEGLRRLNPANLGMTFMAMEQLPLNARPWFKPDRDAFTAMRREDFPVPGRALREYRDGYSKEPDLLTGDTGEEPKKQGLDENNNPWGQKKDLFPEAAAKGRVVVYQTPMFGASVDARPQANERVINPNDPRFNAALFMNPILHQFFCPHGKCKSKFDKASALVAHLRSSAHQVPVRIKCPACLRVWPTMASALQHAESATRTCNIRNRDAFPKFIWDISGGMLNAMNGKGGILNDGTPKYCIPKEFRMGLRDRMAELQAIVEAEAAQAAQASRSARNAAATGQRASVTTTQNWEPSAPGASSASQQWGGSFQRQDNNNDDGW